MNRSIVCFSVAGLALLAACSSESEPEAAADTAASAPPPAAQPAKPAPEDPTAKMPRAVGNGKPGAAVEVKYEFQSKPAVGTPVEVEVALIPNPGVESMDVRFSGMEGVTLAGPLTASFTDVERGKVYTHTFSVLPDRAGVFYVAVAVSSQIGGSSLGRSFSIPFVVGDPPAQQKAAPETDATGEAIEPMKAVETTE